MQTGQNLKSYEEAKFSRYSDGLANFGPYGFAMSIIRKNGLAGRLQDVIDAHRCIRTKHLHLERDLQDQKWFPYRFVSPYRATILFVREYELYYERAFKQHYDKRIPVRPVNRMGLHSYSRLMTQAWTARQKADALGMPYGSYLEFFGDFLMRRGKRKYLPMLNQIEGSDKAKSDRQELLEKFRLERAWPQLMKIDAAQLQNDNFRKLPAQIAFRAWTMETIISSGRTHRQALELVSFQKHLLPPDAFLSLMDEDVYAGHIQTIEANKKHGWLTPEDVHQVDQTDLLPSCFGLFPVSAENRSPCVNCVFAKPCQKIYAKASARMKSDPEFISADDVKRKFDRERQAEHRRRKKDMKSST